MQRNRRRVVLGVALAVNAAAFVLTLGLALQPPTGPGSPDTLYECTLWFTVAELLLLTLYISCILYCDRTIEDLEAKALCVSNCLLFWAFLQISLIFGYIACLVSSILF